MERTITFINNNDVRVPQQLWFSFWKKKSHPPAYENQASGEILLCGLVFILKCGNKPETLPKKTNLRKNNTPTHTSSCRDESSISTTASSHPSHFWTETVKLCNCAASRFTVAILSTAVNTTHLENCQKATQCDEQLYLCHSHYDYVWAAL